MQSLVDDDPAVRSYIAIDAPAGDRTAEFPQFVYSFGTDSSFNGDGGSSPDVNDKIDANNPSEYLEVDDEYVLGDHSGSGGG